MPRKETAADRRDPETGKRLAEARNAKGYTQRQMADIFGISEVAWRNYEKGRELKSGMIVQICAVLECSPNWLLGVNNERMALNPESRLMKQLREAFDELSTEGQKEALKRVQELTHLPQYRAKGENEAGPGDTVPAQIA